MEGTKVIICCKRQRKRGNVLCSDYFNVFGALTHTLEKEKGGSEGGERGANLKPFVTGHQTYDSSTKHLFYLLFRIYYEFLLKRKD